MMMTNVMTPEMAVALGALAFVLFLVLYAIGSLFSRGSRKEGAAAASRERGFEAVPSGPTYFEAVARQQADFVPRGDEPVFTPAPDYAALSMEIPANATYTQVAAATAAAAQRGLKPRMAATASPTPTVQAAQASPVVSYAAIASQTVGEPRVRAEGATPPQRVDYSSVDIDLSGLTSYAAIAVATARGQAGQAKTLH